MSKVPEAKWTKLEKQFDRLIRKSESRTQMERIEGRLQLRAFAEKHGKEKCE